MQRVTTLAIVALASCAPPAYAQVCGSSRDIAHVITTTIGEDRQFSATQSDGSILEIWVHPETHDWTITITRTGVTCVVSHGTNFYDVNDPGDV
jgi:ABC-type transport system involved in cytochrome c biogenesis permease component